MQNRDPDGAISAFNAALKLDRMIWWPSISCAVLIQRAIMPGCRGVSSATLTGACNAEAHYGLGLALSKRINFDQAVGEFEKKAIALQPTLQETHYVLGIILLQQSKLDDAAAALEAATEAKPDYAEAHYALGVSCNTR